MSYLMDHGRWLNKPNRIEVKDECLYIHPEQETNFWKKTYNGKELDNGHFFHLDFECNFELEALVSVTGTKKGDEAGLMVRIDEDYWVKTSMQLVKEDNYEVKVVVTNCGYSDESVHLVKLNGPVKFKIGRDDTDYFVEVHTDGGWKQIRLCHLVKESDQVQAGVFACSPKASEALASFDELRLCEYCD